MTQYKGGPLDGAILPPHGEAPVGTKVVHRDKDRREHAYDPWTGKYLGELC